MIPIRNREFLMEIVLSAAVIAFFTALGCHCRAAWLLPLSGGLILGIHFLYTCRRYAQIKRLCEKIDRALHGQAEILADANREGELSVLETEISKMTLRLLENRDRLLDDRRFLENAISDISHQLRTPLTSMNLTIAMLSKEDASEEKRRRLMHDLHRSVRKLDWLISALLKMSRLDAGTVRFAKDNVPAALLIEKAVSPLEILLEIRAQRLIVQADEILVPADEMWTCEAVSNLLKNCIEHTPEGGEIHITASETPLYTEIAVSDSGDGFDEQDLPHLFERFYKGKNASEDSIGIGLALSHAIITQQEGVIWAENTRTGALFRIRFYKTTV